MNLDLGELVLEKPVLCLTGVYLGTEPMLHSQKHHQSRQLLFIFSSSQVGGSASSQPHSIIEAVLGISRCR